jgi:DsbC/DsbD-like thiol-disulfide interchange protein
MNKQSRLVCNAARAVWVIAWAFGACQLGLALGAADQGGDKKPSHAKLSASVTKADKDGKQVVTIKMKIDDKWHAYANPVQNEDFESIRTTVDVKSANKLQDVKVAYPEGKKTLDKLIGTYFVYEGEVEFKATIRRAAGDSGPLEVKVNFSLCNDKEGCLPVESVVMEVK